jgi:capsule polysaccharide export protein KpsE/RkpR
MNFKRTKNTYQDLIILLMIWGIVLLILWG